MSGFPFRRTDERWSSPLNRSVQGLGHCARVVEERCAAGVCSHRWHEFKSRSGERCPRSVDTRGRLSSTGTWWPAPVLHLRSTATALSQFGRFPILAIPVLTHAWLERKG